MGALTSKINIFKSRPWENMTIKSVSAKDYYFDFISVDVRGKKIMRVLPYIGYDYWIDNHSRFPIKSKLIKFSVVLISFFYIFKLKSVFVMSKKSVFLHLNIKVSIKSIVQEIRELKNLTLIIGSVIDGKIISGIRDLAYLQFVSCFFSENRIFEDKKLKLDNQDIIITMGIKTSYKITRIFKYVKKYIIINELNYVFDSSLKYLISGNNIKTLKQKIEGFYGIKEEVLFFLLSYISNFLPKFINKFNFGPSNFGLFVNGFSYNLSKIKSFNLLNLNSYSKFNRDNRINKKYHLTCVISELQDLDILIPVSSYWSDSRLYIDYKGYMKNSNIICISNISLVSLLFIVFFIDSYNIADNIIFNNIVDDCITNNKEVIFNHKVNGKLQKEALYFFTLNIKMKLKDSFITKREYNRSLILFNYKDRDFNFSYKEFGKDPGLLYKPNPGLISLLEIKPEERDNFYNSYNRIVFECFKDELWNPDIWICINSSLNKLNPIILETIVSSFSKEIKRTREETLAIILIIIKNSARYNNIFNNKLLNNKFNDKKDNNLIFPKENDNFIKLESLESYLNLQKNLDEYYRSRNNNDVKPLSEEVAVNKSYYKILDIKLLDIKYVMYYNDLAQKKYKRDIYNEIDNIFLKLLKNLPKDRFGYFNGGILAGIYGRYYTFDYIKGSYLEYVIDYLSFRGKEMPIGFREALCVDCLEQSDQESKYIYVVYERVSDNNIVISMRQD